MSQNQVEPNWQPHLLGQTLRLQPLVENDFESLFAAASDPLIWEQHPPLITGTHEISKFNREALIVAIRADQEGRSTFQEFLHAAWKAGVVSYDVDFINRKVSYYGSTGENYLEEYPAVEVKK